MNPRKCLFNRGDRRWVRILEKHWNDVIVWVRVCTLSGPGDLLSLVGPETVLAHEDQAGPAGGKLAADVIFPVPAAGDLPRVQPRANGARLEHDHGQRLDLFLVEAVVAKEDAADLGHSICSWPAVTEDFVTTMAVAAYGVGRPCGPQVSIVRRPNG